MNLRLRAKTQAPVSTCTILGELAYPCQGLMSRIYRLVKRDLTPKAGLVRKCVHIQCSI